MNYTQAYRPIAISTPLGEDVLLLRAFTGYEALSQLFRFDLDLLSENDSIVLDDIIGQNATIRIALANGSERHWNGFISRFSQSGREGQLVSYGAQLVPWLWFLSRTSDCRIFQSKTVPEIIQQVFNQHGYKDFSLRLYGEFPQREYCVQYRETDLNFVSRLMEQEGIYYFFEHENGKHTLVLANDPAAHKPGPHQSAVRYDVTRGGRQHEDIVLDWNTERDFRPGGYALTDYNFQSPSTSLFAKVAGNNSWEMYDYPGEYRKRPEGERLARIRLEEQQAPLVVSRGSSTCRAFTTGNRFELRGHYRSDLNREHLITALRHSVSIGDGYLTAPGHSRDGESPYTNVFECIPYSTRFRPPRATPQPFVQGCQTAVVVGPAGEEIFTDKYGRVKVQFHWDRYGKHNENSSCWIRVSQTWAGKRWGSMWIPRIGQEVIVDFLEGDPDRPIITGRVYHAESMPPYTLPDEKTKSTVKSNSSKGGEGFNEIRFEDKKGSEQIFMHAERNQDTRVKNDSLEWIGHDKHVIVGHDQLEQIGGDLHVRVKGDRNEKIEGTSSLTASADLQAKVGEKYALGAGTEIHLKSGLNVVIESGTTLTLKVGGNFININPGGVFIKGAMVMLNSGGAAGSGAGAHPAIPKSPQEADRAKPGEPAKPPPKPTSYGQQAMALKQASANGRAFCYI